MNICGHIVQTGEIIGIGPVMMQKHGDRIDHELCNIRMYWFMLHLKNHSVKIETNWLYLGFDGMRTTAAEEEDRAVLLKFLSEYEIVRDVVVKMIELHMKKIDTGRAAKVKTRGKLSE